jgi:ABC-type hemin transport system substrate-binding protein
VRRFRFHSLLLIATALTASCGGVEAPPAVAPPGPPRIISLSPSVTDTLVALGAGPQIVGVCAVQGGGDRLPGVPDVAAFGTVDAERILTLRPSFCATVRGMQDPQALADLRRLGLEVVEYPVDTLAQLWACTEDLGRRAGLPEAGVKLAEEGRSRVARAGAGTGVGRPRVAILLSVEPTVVAGEGTFLAELLSVSGFTNVAAPLRGYPQMDAEALARSRPDALIFPQGDLPEESAAGVADLLGHIVQSKPLLVGVEADLLVRPGPRTPEAVEHLAELGRRLRRVGSP